MMLKILVLFVSAMMIVSCGQEAMETSRSPNGAEAKLIAVVDGCRIWRLEDQRTVYVARCPEGAQQTAHYSGGKSPSLQQTIGQ